MKAHLRRMAIWNRLYHRRQVTAAYLATEFQVSPRTIRYDIEILSLSYPIITIQGGHGGIRVPEWYKHKAQAYSPAQMELLLRLATTLDGEDAIIMEGIIERFQP